MAAKALVVPVCFEDAGFWDEFRRHTENRVREGNILAGERLWELVLSSSPGSRLMVRSTKHGADRIECTMDLGSRLLTCVPGSAIGSDPLIFHLIEGTSWKLARDGVECTIDQAVAWILDRLVWLEDRTCELSGVTNSERR